MTQIILGMFSLVNKATTRADIVICRTQPSVCLYNNRATNPQHVRGNLTIRCIVKLDRNFIIYQHIPAALYTRTWTCGIPCGAWT